MWLAWMFGSSSYISNVFSATVNQPCMAFNTSPYFLHISTYLRRKKKNRQNKSQLTNESVKTMLEKVAKTCSTGDIATKLHKSITIYIKFQVTLQFISNLRALIKQNKFVTQLGSYTNLRQFLLSHFLRKTIFSPPSNYC